ncbi:MAG TPA: GNAT family N-acetyltransferase, partial [Aggregatilineales bacterium]|nr:GNAT family N-acetyltransferase [Aggregatilineales bacterium]
ELLAELLELAKWSPSAHNRQPWRFAVVSSADTQLGIVIHKEWRSRGAGNTLMNAAIEWARANDFVQRISLNVYDDNARAIHLYSKLGFKIEGRRHKALFKHGRYYDELIMGLLLADD